MAPVASLSDTRKPISFNRDRLNSRRTANAVGSANNYRKLRLLAELDIADASERDANYHTRFAERLAQLIDLSGSIKLSIAHSELAALAVEPSTVTVDDIKTEFLKVHSLVVDSVLKSFTPAALREHRQWAELPSPDFLLAAILVGKTDKALKPYLEFYRLQQKQISAKVKRLRSLVQAAAAGLSVQLAQLAKLDAVLGDELMVYSRRSFAQVTQLLSRRFAPAVEQGLVSLNAGPNNKNVVMQLHVELCREMQGLLLAEIEVHLLPVLGLIEAIDEEIE